MDHRETAPENRAPGFGGSRGKFAVLVVVLAIAGAFYGLFGDQLSLNMLADRESQLREIHQRHPAFIYGMAFLIYVSVTGLSLPGAAGLSLLYGWYFGPWKGVLLVSFASTAGATLAFLLSRFLLGNTIQKRYGSRLASFNRALDREGPMFLFSLRLIPLVPFFVVNLVMGLTPIRAFTFWWVSQLGMLPGTVAYVYAGSSVPDLQALADKGVRAAFDSRQLWQIAIAFGILAVLPWLLKYLLSVARKALGHNAPADSFVDHPAP